MNTKDFKIVLKNNPDIIYIYFYLQQFILFSKYNNLEEYFKNTKDLHFADDSESLYKVKGQIFLLKTFCSHIVQLIDKLDLHLTEEFDDKLIELNEIGINSGDIFICTSDYLHWDLMSIKAGSLISINEFKYAGCKSLFSAKIIHFISDYTIDNDFVYPDDLPLILNFKELQDNFKKV